jgi:hypothetical protein
MKEMAPPSRKGCCEWQRKLRWDLDGNLGMVEGLDSGKITGLAIQYWEIYFIISEQGCTVRDTLDGANLRFTFPRTVDNRVM